jgi:hypothetical protein
MKQVELTSKLVLAIIGLTSVGAILVPTYAVPTIRSGDIFDETIQSVDIKNGEVKNADLAPNAVTSDKIKNGEVKAEDIAAGVIPSGGGNIETRIITTGEQVVAPGELSGDIPLQCNDDEVVTGGGIVIPAGYQDAAIVGNDPTSSNDWRVNVANTGESDITVIFTGKAVCAKIVP